MSYRSGNMNQISAGMLRRRVEAGGFVVTESEYAPEAATLPHAHALTSLVFGLSGSLEQTHGSRSGTMLPRRTLVLPRDAVHADRVSSQGCRCLFVTLAAEEAVELGARSQALATPRFTADSRLAVLAQRLRREMWADDHFAPVALEGLALEALARIGRQQAPRPERRAAWLRRLREQLQEDFAAPRPIAVLAQEAGVHPAYLVRTFHRHYGETIGAFVRRTRLAWAMNALVESGDSVAQIAATAGFFDQSHFTRVFKREVGVTPGVFRRTSGQADERTGS